MTAPRDRLEWLAAADQIAHARRPREPRVLCGIRAVDPRLAWPAVVRCPDCLMVAGQKAVPMGL